MIRFQQFLSQEGLVSLDATGVPFTWTNNHRNNSILFERLDRVVANPKWFTAFPNASLENLPIVGSDHGPICLSLHNKPSFSSFGFKFEAMWLRHPDFSNVVQGAWSNHVAGSSVQKFVTLCHSFKCLARTWNKNVFGDLFNKIKGNQEDLQNIQAQLMINPTDHYLSQRNMELTKISFDLHRSEEIYWEQKARANWLEHGDKNTRFFQMQASIRKKRNNISRIKDDCGNWILDMDAVADFFVQDFKKRFTHINYPSNLNLCSFLEVIDDCISPETNEQLIANVSRNEVFNAISSIGSIKAPCLDGIHAAFFQSFWDIVGNSVFDIVNGFFQNCSSLSSINHTNIVLIPKVDNPETVSSFRPISLCNVIYKVISKVMINRLKPVLKVCISQNQGAFAPGRSIMDNILITRS